MQKISKLKALWGENACLSANDAFHLKGGNNSQSSNNKDDEKDKDALAKLQNKTEDDKRRERPGGLTSQ